MGKLLSLFLELIFEPLLSRPWLIALLLVGSLVGIAIWFYMQVQESKASDQFHRSERERGDSIWND